MEEFDIGACLMPELTEHNVFTLEGNDHSSSREQCDYIGGVHIPLEEYGDALCKIKPEYCGKNLAVPSPVSICIIDDKMLSLLGKIDVTEHQCLSIKGRFFSAQDMIAITCAEQTPDYVIINDDNGNITCNNYTDYSIDINGATLVTYTSMYIVGSSDNQTHNEL